MPLIWEVYEMGSQIATEVAAVVTEVPAVPTAAAAAVAEGAKPAADEALGEGGLTALKAERATAAAAEKRAAAAEARIKEFEDRDKTAEQKAQDDRDRLEKEIQELKVAKTIAEVSASSSIPSAILAGPASSEPADMEAYAAALADWRGAAKPAAPAEPTGVVPTIGQSPLMGNVSLHDQIAAATATGDKALVAALKAQQLGATS